VVRNCFICQSKLMTLHEVWGKAYLGTGVCTEVVWRQDILTLGVWFELLLECFDGLKNLYFFAWQCTHHHNYKNIRLALNVCQLPYYYLSLAKTSCLYSSVIALPYHDITERSPTVTISPIFLWALLRLIVFKERFYDIPVLPSYL
jgi:hypothetical protein